MEPAALSETSSQVVVSPLWRRRKVPWLLRNPFQSVFQRSCMESEQPRIGTRCDKFEESTMGRRILSTSCMVEMKRRRVSYFSTFNVQERRHCGGCTGQMWGVAFKLCASSISSSQNPKCGGSGCERCIVTTKVAQTWTVGLQCGFLWVRIIIFARSRGCLGMDPRTWFPRYRGPFLDLRRRKRESGL